MKRAVAAVTAALAVVAVVVWQLAGSGGGGGEPASTTSPPTTTSTAPASLPRMAPGPVAYHLVYLVSDVAGEEELLSTEEIWVRRPFDGRSVLRRGRPPGTEELSVTISSFGRYSTSSLHSSALVVPVQPRPPTGDLRLDATLPDLVAAGAAGTRGTKTVLGRRCTVYRFGEPVGTAALPEPTGDAFADTCVDEEGFVLDEVWVDGGRTLRTRTLTAFEAEPVLDDTLFAGGEPTLPADQGGGALAPFVDGNRPPITLWALPAPPPGFRHLGRFRFDPPRPPGADGSTAPAAPTVDDVYVDDAGRIVVIEQGQLESTSRPTLGRLGRDVEMELPDATVAPGPHGNVVLGFPDAVRFVRVVATLPLDDVIAIARQLRSEPPRR